MLLPFIKDGFECGDKAFHIVDPDLREEHLRRLESAGIDVTKAQRSGQFSLFDWHAAYFQHGHFDQNKPLALIEEVLNDGARQGLLTRSVGHVELAPEDRQDLENWVEYEARLNYILPGTKTQSYESMISPSLAGRSSWTLCGRIQWSSSAACFMRTRSSCRPMSFCGNCANAARRGPIRWQTLPDHGT